MKTSLDDVLKDLAETSTIHGIPRFVPGRHWAIRLLWLLAFLCSSGYMLYQLVGLFDEYFSYKVNVDSTLKFSALRFPAISFCNMNPIKLSKLGDASTSLRELVEESFTPESATSGRRKRNAISSLSLPIQPTPASLFNIPLLSVQATLLGGSSLLLPVDSAHLPALDQSFDSILPSIGNLVPSSAVSLLTDDPNNLSKNYLWKYLDQINDADLLTSYLSTFSKYDTFVGEEVDIDGAVDWQHYFYQDLLADKDEWMEKTELFRVFFKNQTLQKRWSLGHGAEDLVHKAIFDTRLQNPQNFLNFTTPHYGNCFTLPSTEHIAWRSGPDQGINLILNLEVDEYIPSLSTGYGVRMVIHKPGTYPFPTEEGFTLDPGREINIGLRMVQINRLSEPYSRCTDGHKFWKLYGVHYSVTLCLHMCHSQRTLAVCGCLLPDSPDIQLNTTDDVPVCNELNLKDKFCVLSVTANIDDGTFTCDCDNPCSEIAYDVAISGRSWPNDDYLEKVLMKELCEKERKKNSTYITDHCVRWSNGSFSELIQRFHDNFLSVNIYYEDLNYEVITEEPQFQIERFLADIGGASGLFIGASILSVMELFELIVEIFLHVLEKGKGHNANSVNVELTSTL